MAPTGTASPAEQDAAPNAQEDLGNNDEDPTESFDCKGRQEHPEMATTCKTTGAVLDTDAFVLDGESFYDAVAVESDDARTTLDESTDFAYWGLQVDSETQVVYYFNHLQPEQMQWLPPADLIHPDTHEVLLWDALEQWFFYYNPQTKESKWLDDKDNSSTLQQPNDAP